MSSCEIRTANPDDWEGVSELCFRALLSIDVVDHRGLERLLWQTADMAGLVAMNGSELVGAAFGTVTSEATGVIAGAVTLLAVDPGSQGGGIGSRLLTGLEHRLHELGATEVWTGGGQPRFWWPGVDANSDGVLRFFEWSGYERDDDAVNMVTRLSDLDLDPRPSGDLEIRRLTPGDWPAFHDWMERMWDDPWGDEVTTALDRSPVSCFVAQRAGEYVGFAAYDTNRRGWFGPMGSAPEARGTGIGGELLRSCLRDYVAQGLDQCEIGWVGPLDFYANAVGAVVSRHFVRLRKDLPS